MVESHGGRKNTAQTASRQKEIFKHLPILNNDYIINLYLIVIIKITEKTSLFFKYYNSLLNKYLKILQSRVVMKISFYITRK